MSGPPPYTGVKKPDYNLALGVVPFIWTFTAISAAVLALRLFAVYHVLRRVRAADYTMVAAFVRPTCYPLIIQYG
jgi:tryptophan-rich sensory protein